MKRQLFTLIFALALSVGLSTGSTYAQSSEGIRAEVPFAFTAHNETFPAGAYRIKAANDNRSIWMIQPKSAGQGEFFLAGGLAGRSNYGTLRLTFRRYGERSFLIGFETPSYEVALPRSKDEKALSRYMLTKHDVISIETVAEVSR